MNDGKRQVTDETEPDENPIATIHYENGTELTGKAVTLQDGTVGVRIPNEFFKTALLPDGSIGDRRGTGVRRRLRRTVHARRQSWEPV